jgi:hypothetical protein
MRTRLRRALGEHRSVNMVFLCVDAQSAQAFRAVVRNRFGLAVVIYDDDEAKVYVGGDDTDDCEITRQVKALADWLGARDRTPRIIEHVKDPLKDPKEPS